MGKQTRGVRQPSARVVHKREQARLEILEAAQDLLHTGGVEAVTLASVAGSLSMTKQALYHYFPSKDALFRSLITTLLDNEVESIAAAVNKSEGVGNTLGTLIHAFYDHYIDRLNAFRMVYCQSQFYSGLKATLDSATLREEINPRTRHLFDVLEARMGSSDMSQAERKRTRQLAFSAWLAALGLLTMLGVADATDDPLIHSDQELIDTLIKVFESA